MPLVVLAVWWVQVHLVRVRSVYHFDGNNGLHVRLLGYSCSVLAYKVHFVLGRTNGSCCSVRLGGLFRRRLRRCCFRRRPCVHDGIVSLFLRPVIRNGVRRYSRFLWAPLRRRSVFWPLYRQELPLYRPLLFGSFVCLVL